MTICNDFDASVNFTYAMNSESLVTAIDVARYLGVVKNAVCRWREHRGLPVLEIELLWTLQLSDVDEWVRADGAAEDQGRENE